MLKYLATLSIAALVSTPAMAQNAGGARVEFTAGYDNTSGKISYADSADSTGDFSESESSSGAAFGGTIGYDLGISSKAFVGVEGSIDLASNKRCGEIFGNDSACFSVKRSYAIGGRIGAYVAETARLYVGAAYANGKARVSYVDELDAANNFSLSDSRGGVRFSGGIEAQIAGNFYTKAEYRYTNYKDYKVSEGTEKVSLGFDRHQVLAGFGVRF